MAVLFDARGNEFQGSLDQIGGGVVTDARVASAALTAVNSEMAMDLNAKAVATFQIITGGATTGTLVFEGTVDGVNYIGLSGWEMTNESIQTNVVLASSQSRIFVVGVSGLRRVRVRVSVVVAGSCVAHGRASESDFAIYARPQPSLLHVTATAAVNTGATATLGLVAGLFHYITRIELVKLYSVIGVAAGAGVIVTSTNLPGGPAWTTEQLASAAGTATRVIDYNCQGAPLKSAAAGVATTLVAPAQLQTIWRWNVSYYLGA